MIIFCIIFTLVCCWATYIITCHQVIKLSKILMNGIETNSKYIGKCLNEIKYIKTGKK